MKGGGLGHYFWNMFRGVKTWTEEEGEDSDPLSAIRYSLIDGFGETRRTQLQKRESDLGVLHPLAESLAKVL